MSSQKRAAGRWLQWLIVAAPFLSLAGCGSSDSGEAASGSPAASAVQAPTTLNLYPSSTGEARLYVMVTAVGSAAMNLPLDFDTGSAGVTLNALSLFPASMVSSTGFVFPSGQTSMTYQGITVTTQQSIRAYGSGQTARDLNGNLGFATLTFGDSQGTLTTASMPILF